MKRIILVGLLFSTPALAVNSFEVVEDPMTDVKRGIAVLNSGGKIIPVIKCDENGKGSLYVSFISENYLGAVRYKNRAVKVRFDSSAPYDVMAYHDGRSASIFDLKPGSANGRLLKDMMTAGEMVVQVTDYDYNTYTEKFSLGNAGEVIKSAIETCGDTEWITQ
jgi:hypothetical protein